jgi:hypothetical protein
VRSAGTVDRFLSTTRKTNLYLSRDGGFTWDEVGAKARLSLPFYSIQYPTLMALVEPLDCRSRNALEYFAKRS